MKHSHKLLLLLCSVLFAFALVPGSHAASHTPASVCTKMASFQKKAAAAAKKRRKARCEMMMNKFRTRYPKRFLKAAACIEKQATIQGFQKHCVSIMLGGRKKAKQAMQRYAGRAKEAMAKLNLMKLQNAAILFFQKHKRFPKSSAWMPKKPCCEQAGKRCSQPPAKSMAGLEFPIQKHVRSTYFQYRLRSKGKGKSAALVLEAQGSPICQGKTITYTITIALDGAGNPKAAKPKRSES